MKPLEMRRRIRAITDKLREGEDLIRSEIYARLRGKKPSMGALQTTINVMVDAGELEAFDAPPNRGQGVKKVYRSGPEPVDDGRVHAGMIRRRSSGFAALRRLEEQDPAEWARITENGTL